MRFFSLKNKKGSFLLTSIIILMILSLLGWAFVYTTIALNSQTQKAFLSKQAYYAADAGIEEASMELWTKFKDCGITANKTEIFLQYVQDEWDLHKVSGDYYVKKELEDLSGFDNSEYYVFIEPVEDLCDDYQVVVKITSKGRSYINKENDNYTQRKIITEIKYYLTTTELLDFAYFGNNFAWHEGAIRNGGSMGTNGWMSLNGPYIAGGDRYEECKNYDLIGKRDDGGLYAPQGFDKKLKYNDYTDIYPKTADQYGVGTKTIAMPSLASSTYYERYAKEEEKRVLDKGEKYGIYYWVPEGTVLDNGGGLTEEVQAGGKYIKICDSVYGDDLFGTESTTGYYLENDVWYKGERENLLITNPDPDHPLQLYGTVVVDENVAIKGVVDGSGAIYAGNNIYVTGGIEYSDKPSKAKGNTNTDVLAGYRGFTGSNDGDNDYNTKCPQTLSQAESNQQEWLEANKPTSPDVEGGKDFLGLFANGSICVGDVTSSSIQNDMTKLLNNDKKTDFMTGTIQIKEKDKYVEETVNYNETDEALLGYDKVPNTRKSKDKNDKGQYMDEEYETETNMGWDVSFYTADNPPPEDPDDPTKYAVNPATGDRYEILGGEAPDPNTPYYSWSDNQKKAVIPGSGEDLDSDGIYDAPLDVYHVVAFCDEDADAVKNKVSKWEDVLQFDPSEWGGNVDLKGANMAFKNVLDNYNPSYQPKNTYVYRLDAMTYTNHMWGGYIQGPSNGSIITRVECTYVDKPDECPVNHDDRVAGGGESLRDTNVIMPQVEHMEILTWIE